MTLPEFFGCLLVAFGTPLVMFIMTIVKDPVRIITLLVSSFVWLCSLLISSLIWFAVVPLREYTFFGLVVSVLIQEAFRYGFYRVLRITENGLKEVTDNSPLLENKHILAYVSGLGFGIISGAFAISNILADSVGPATIGLLSGHEWFLMSSSAQALCMILLHTCWGVIFFNGIETESKFQISYVVISHLLVSCLTLLNADPKYIGCTLTSSYLIAAATMMMAFKVVGGTAETFKRFITCK